MVFEFEFVGEPNGARLSHSFDDAIVLQGRPGAPCFERMITPCVTTHRFEVDECFGPNWSYWCCIKQVHALYLFKHR